MVINNRVVKQRDDWENKTIIITQTQKDYAVFKYL